MGAIKEVFVPDIGDFKGVDVIEVLVKPGDRVEKDGSIVTLESDKATMEIPSPVAGVVRELRVKIGDKVSQGSSLLLLEESAKAPAAEKAPEAAPPAWPPSGEKASPGEDAARAPAEPDRSAAPRTTEFELQQAPLTAHLGPVPYEPQDTAAVKPHASPSVRKFARELGVDLFKVKGSGQKGRILQDNVQAFVKSVMKAAPLAEAAPAPSARLPFDLPDLPQLDFAKFGPVEVKPLSRIKKISGANLHRNWLMIPHVTQFEEADITDLEVFRKANNADTEKQGFKLTMLAFLIKACVTALRQFPDFNASLDKAGENLIVKKYYHVGVAVDTPAGLVVPVIRDADRKGVFDLARELAEMSGLAREKKLKPGDMQGGTFSISSLGGIGGTAFTPIINAPEVAILGVSRSVMRSAWTLDKNGVGEFRPRLMLPLSLSYDHRVVDGAAAARFTGYLAAVLSDIRRTLL